MQHHAVDRQWYRIDLKQCYALIMHSQDCMCAQRRLRSACLSAHSNQSSLSAWGRFLLLVTYIVPWEDLSICMDAQVDLSLRWVHMQSCWEMLCLSSYKRHIVLWRYSKLIKRFFQWDITNSFQMPLFIHYYRNLYINTNVLWKLNLKYM